MITRRSGPAHWRRIAGRVLLGGIGAAVLLALLLWWQTMGEADQTPPPESSNPAEIKRGEYLARIGNCSGCHTEVGGDRLAGGRGIPTPFGTVYASNITPDIGNGIGAWSEQAFWRAMHHGRSRDGRLLYPAFPYPNFTHVARQDSDALLAYLRSQPAVPQVNRPHDLRFPYNTGMALAAWRMMFFRAADSVEDPPRSAAEPAQQLERGAYLVNGLGHCSACHARRNFLGGSFDPLQVDGGLLPGEPWVAPSLAQSDQAGVADWSTQQVVDLLRAGRSERGSVQGPMAEVVFGATQYLDQADAVAMAVYLKSIASTSPVATPASVGSAPVAPAGSSQPQGENLYADHCASCHGKQGQGEPDAYPALAGNRSLLLDPPVNLLQIIVHGGFAPATAANPRPFGMPPFGITLSQAEIAALMTYLRGTWGHQATAVSARDVQRWMETPGVD